MKIHQKYCELPIAATGAAASATNTTQITVSTQFSILNFFFFSPICQAPFSFGMLQNYIESFLIPYSVVNVPLFTYLKVWMRLS